MAINSILYLQTEIEVGADRTLEPEGDVTATVRTVIPRVVYFKI